MSKLIFRPEDFKPIVNAYTGAANLAQEIFDKWLSEQPVVYKCESNPGWWHGPSPTPSTHTARLVDIQEIKQKECNHAPSDLWRVESGIPARTFSSQCKHCGAELTATWSVKK